MKKRAWYDLYPEDLSWDLIIDEGTVVQMLEDTAARFPDQIAIEFMGYTLSYAQLLSQVNHMAAAMQERGVVQGSRVGIFLPNCPQFIISYYAILKLGGTVVNFSPLYAKDEILHQLLDAEVEVMVTLNLKILYPKLYALLGEGEFNSIICACMQDFLPFPKNYAFRLFKQGDIATIHDDARIIQWRELLQSTAEFDKVELDPRMDTAVIQYTGGTTGVPKGAELTHQNIYANAQQCAHWFHKVEDGEGSNLGVLPFFHVFAMTTVMNLSIAKGLTIILHPRFELKKVLKDITQKKPLLLLGVPTMFTAINNYRHIDRYDLSSVKYCFSGGASLPVEVKKQFESLSHGTLVEGYGLTETSPVVCANPIWGKGKEGSIGIPFPMTEVRIESLEEKEQFLPIGERGQLCIRGPQVMKGYWNNPEETIASMTKDGFFRTGDIATMDKEGYVFIVDRLKEMINVAGFKVYPRTVEEAIYRHEAVLEVAVIGVRDEQKGQKVKAVVVLKEEQRLLPEELIYFLEEHLGKHEMPKLVEFVSELPKTMIGKIEKKKLS